MFLTISRNAGVGVALALGLGAGVAQAAGSVAWTAPANNSTFAVGTLITPSGVANATGVVGGSGLDLVFALDYSGSMSQALRATQRDAATALLDALPAASTSVGIVGFGANVVTLSPLTPVSSGQAALTTQLAVLNPAALQTFSTDTAGAINQAAALLRADDNGRDKQMVVITDGAPNSQVAAVNAATAAKAGTPSVQVNTVGLPNTSFGNQEAIATAGGGTFVTAGSLQSLIDLFTGTSGNLVGIDQIDVTLPDGTLLSDVPLTSGLGNFDVTQAFALGLGNNFWTVNALFTDGGTAQATLNVIGVAPGPNPNPVPLPAAAWLLISGVASLGAVSRMRRRA